MADAAAGARAVECEQGFDWHYPARSCRELVEAVLRGDIEGSEVVADFTRAGS